MTIGERVRIVRLDYGFTQDQVANTIYVSRSLVGNIESGKAKATKRFIKNFCEGFHVNEIWLTTGEGSRYGEEISYRLKTSTDVWNTATGYIFKYAHIMKSLIYSCDLDDSIWSIFNDTSWIEVFNFIISRYLLPAIKDDGKRHEFLERFKSAFPDFENYWKEMTDNKWCENRQDLLRKKPIWDDLGKISYAVIDDPAIVGIEEAATRENNILSHRIYVKIDDV